MTADPPPVQYVTTTDGYNIAYAVCGNGIPLVRVPSLFSQFSLQWSRGILEQQYRALAEHFQLVLFDSRGQGLSTRGLTETTSAAHFEKDIEALAGRLGLDRFVLVGVSAKAKVAASFAVSHPERVIALVLDSYVDLHRTSRPALLELMKSDWPFYLQTTARVGWPIADPEVVFAVNRESMTQADHVLQYTALAADPSDDLLRQVRVPTLVMATREDVRPMGMEQEARRIAALIPNARLVIFDSISGGFISQEASTPPAIVAMEQLLQDVGAVLPAAQTADLPAGLSQREVEVLRVLAGGKSNQQIADELVISVHTVNRHVSNILDKIGAANRVEATVYARDRGLV